MAEKRRSQDQYLQQVGGTWYARVRVPRTLEKYTGQTHIRRSLKTGDRQEANRLKHAVVAGIKDELERLRKAPDATKERGTSFADAREWREAAAALEAVGDHHNLEELSSLAATKAEELERLYGLEKAKRWHKAATVTSENLAELMARYMSASDYKESTKQGHKKSLTELLEFVGDADAHPTDITPKTALSYIDKDLTQRGIAYNTIRDKLISLGGFWRWMATRGAVPAGSNPWRDHKISKKKHTGRAPPKRMYSDAELMLLLKGTPEAKQWPTYSYLPDLMVLGLFTGCREEELCCLKIADIAIGRGSWIINVTDSKTKAGLRLVAVTHPAPLAILKRRTELGGERLFPELKPGGEDNKFSSSAVKAYTRYRRACGVPDGTDFHSFRRNVITVLERARVGQVEIARYVGHKVGTMAGDTYSGGGDRKGAVSTARKIKYSKAIEASAENLAQRPDSHSRTKKTDALTRARNLPALKPSLEANQSAKVRN